MMIPPGIDPPDARLANVLRPHWRATGWFVGAGLAAALILLLVLPRPHAGAVKRIDPTATIVRASQLGTLPVYAPAPLPAGWIPDSVHLDAGKGRELLHLGYQSPDFGHVGLEETSSVKWRKVLSQTTGGGRLQDYVTINGHLWAHLRSTRKVLDSLIWFGPSSEVVIAGTTTLANLEQLATSLHVP